MREIGPSDQGKEVSAEVMQQATQDPRSYIQPIFSELEDEGVGGELPRQ